MVVDEGRGPGVAVKGERATEARWLARSRQGLTRRPRPHAPHCNFPCHFHKRAPCSFDDHRHFAEIEGSLYRSIKIDGVQEKPS